MPQSTATLHCGALSHFRPGSTNPIKYVVDTAFKGAKGADHWKMIRISYVPFDIVGLEGCRVAPPGPCRDDVRLCVEQWLCRFLLEPLCSPPPSTLFALFADESVKRNETGVMLTILQSWSCQSEERPLGIPQ